MTAGGELVVVVPRRFDQREIPAIVEAKRPWIERARARVRRGGGRRAQRPSTSRHCRSASCFRRLGEEWQVEYRAALPGAGSGPSVAGGGGRQAGGRRGHAGDAEACRRALVALAAPAGPEGACRRGSTNWRACIGLRFGEVTVRHQRTRWGSCSPPRSDIAERAPAVSRPGAGRLRAASRALPHAGDEPLTALLGAAAGARSGLDGPPPAGSRGAGGRCPGGCTRRTPPACDPRPRSDAAVVGARPGPGSPSAIP